MKVPLNWLREFVGFSASPERLAEDLTQVGLAVDALTGAGEDQLLEIDVTTNRVDCMNVYGVAREVSVLYDLPLKPLDLSFTETGPPAGDALQVEIEAPDLCPRFCARVMDVRLGPSPDWIRRRLELVGVRPIHNVVDLSNYVMMEMGHPSHAFDLARIGGGKLIARWPRAGEQVKTLDGVERRLGMRDGVVAGESGVLGLAGVMGGASSEVSEATRSLALEAAYWDPLAIRRTAKALGLSTEASHRFERTADPEGPPVALARIAHLLAKVGAGSTRPGLIDCRPVPRADRRARLRSAFGRRLLGAEIAPKESERILRGLGFEVRAASDGELEVVIPSWRGDVAREADLIEEVGRHYGLGRIPSTVPAHAGAEGLRPAQRQERVLRDALESAGLAEVINYSFVSDRAAHPSPGTRVRLANALAEVQDVLRTSLVVPGLLSSLQTNLRQGRRDVRLFEIGRIFRSESSEDAGADGDSRSPDGGVGAVREGKRLGLLMTGSLETHWSVVPARAVDFYDVKGLLEALARRVGLRPLEVSAATPPAFLHPGRSAWIVQGSRRLGWLGALHPELARQWEFRDEVVVAEVALEPLVSAADTIRFLPLERFPAVTRDLSLLITVSLTAAELEARIRTAAGPLLRGVTVVDRYDRPPNVPAGKVSLTLSLRYQDPARTLTGDEVQASLDTVVRELRAGGAEIRGE